MKKPDRTRLIQVDAFADRPFTGNPAAVCILTAPKGAAWMQRVAMEMNLSETAFIRRQGDGFGLRWFTPKLEVNLCGHATLASAHALWQEGLLRPDETARFHTRSGLLTAWKKGDWIELDFPRVKVTPAQASRGLVRALGLKKAPRYVGRTAWQYLVEVGSEREVRGMDPVFGLLEALPAHGFIVTSRASSKAYDFISRYFAPAEGIPEYSVTGSAHCSLGPYWAARFGKNELVGYQASARGGVVRVRSGNNRVYLGGQAVTDCSRKHNVDYRYSSSFRSPLVA